MKFSPGIMRVGTMHSGSADERGARGGVRAGPSLRVCLFTDTLGDVNGVSRFIRNMGEQAIEGGAALDIVTSTRFECPQRPNMHNARPRYSRAMPGYPTLDVVWPNARELVDIADRLAPDVVHVSTPGPVGAVGRRYALRRGLPLVGTYHTDFPVYVAHLFDDELLARVCAGVMKRFYRPFVRVLLRSDEYARALGSLGVGKDRREVLTCGIDTAAFSPRWRDPDGAIWRGVEGVRVGSVKVLYVGRVSVEKNLALLARAWGPARAHCEARGVDAQLVIVGDGPYRAQMREALGCRGAVFAGFRGGQELSAMYASSDLFVFPSMTDTLGQAVLEAQASGLPVIVSDVGGPRGVVDRDRTGLVLPAQAGSEASWARAISDLACDQARRREWSARASAKIAPMTIRRSFEHFWEVHERAASCIRARRGT